MKMLGGDGHGTRKDSVGRGPGWVTHWGKGSLWDSEEALKGQTIPLPLPSTLLLSLSFPFNESPSDLTLAQP